jgi:crossover junction endodeoxyribonuclease RuvC
VTSAPTVIGLDTSLTATGIASSNGWCHVVGWTDKKRPLTKLPHTERLAAMEEVRRDIILHIGQPDLAVLETPALSRAGGGGHERGWLWWEIYSHLISHNIPVGLVSTNQRMLYATGKGTATKNVIVDAVARRWPDWPTGGNDNAADAVVLMAAGRDALGHPITPMPQANRAAITKAVWPATLTGALA